MRTAVIALFATAFAATLSAADVAGRWNVDGDVVGNPVKLVCALQQQGETLSGTAILEGKADVPVSGSSSGQNVSFEFDTDHEGTTYHLVFTGVLGPDGGITGSIAVAGVTGTFTAKKQ